MRSAYHAQTDGQTDRVNQCMETFSWCFVHACPRQWYSWLHLAEFWYNTCSHSALGCSPFEVLYGHAPRLFGLSFADAILCLTLLSCYLSILWCKFWSSNTFIVPNNAWSGMLISIGLNAASRLGTWSTSNTNPMFSLLSLPVLIRRLRLSSLGLWKSL